MKIRMKDVLRELDRRGNVRFGSGEISTLPQKIGDSLASALSFLNRFDYLYGQISKNSFFDKESVETRRKIGELDKLILKASDIAYKLKQEFKDW